MANHNIIINVIEVPIHTKIKLYYKNNSYKSNLQENYRKETI